MSQGSLEDRVARLEDVVAQIVNRDAVETTPREKDWRRTTGMFADDPVMKEIIDEALRRREEERQAFRDEHDAASQ